MPLEIRFVATKATCLRKRERELKKEREREIAHSLVKRDQLVPLFETPNLMLMFLIDWHIERLIMSLERRDQKRMVAVTMSDGRLVVLAKHLLLSLIFLLSQFKFTKILDGRKKDQQGQFSQTTIGRVGDITTERTAKTTTTPTTTTIVFGFVLVFAGLVRC